MVGGCSALDEDGGRMFTAVYLVAVGGGNGGTRCWQQLMTDYEPWWQCRGSGSWQRV